MLCDEDRIYALVIDHINGGGCKHAKVVGSIYSWLIKNNYPSGYQVLCQNHNKEKARINNEYNSKTKTSEKQKELDDVKWSVFSVYSNSNIPYCKSCNETNFDYLELDHINGDGYKQKNDVGHRQGGDNFYRKLKRLGYPNKDKYQVLCSNCNLVKRKENNEFHRPKI